MTRVAVASTGASATRSPVDHLPDEISPFRLEDLANTPRAEELFTACMAEAGFEYRVNERGGDGTA